MRQSGTISIRSLTVTGAAAALTAAVAPFAVPVGPVPITLCTLALYLSAYALGWRRAAAAAGVYVLLGAAGMPVFNGFSAGLGVVAGPTGGYIIGYIPLAALAGLAAERFPRSRGGQLAGLAAATAVLYALGTAWYCAQSGTALLPALWTCVFPFLPGDLAKLAAAMALGPAVRRGLERAGFFPMHP